MESSTEGGHQSKLLFAMVFTLIVGGLVLLGVAFAINNLNKTVVINDDGRQKVEVVTMLATVKDVLNQYGVKLRPEDKVVPAPDEPITDGDEISIERATAVRIIADGKDRMVFTTQDTVLDVLQEQSIPLGERDKIDPGVRDSIRPGLNITITRVKQEEILEKEALPYEVIVKKNDDLDLGVERVVQEGKEGQLERKIVVVYEDGHEVSRQVVKEEIVSEPVNTIIEKGTARYFTTSRGERVRYRKVLNMTATAYTAGYESTGKRPGDKYYGRTATGAKVRRGIVAVDPRVIPLGTKLYVTGYGYAVAADVGGGVKGNKIDLYMETTKEAYAWGRRRVKVYILR